MMFYLQYVFFFITIDTYYIRLIVIFKTYVNILNSVNQMVASYLLTMRLCELLLK